MQDLSLASWQAFLTVPRGEQRAAVQAWLDRLPPETSNEAWNAAFGEGSLFDAWTRTSLVQALHGANASLLEAHLAGRSGWRALEIGGGDGRLWSRVQAGPGTLVVIDPAGEVRERVERSVPDGVEVVAVEAPVEEALDRDELWRDLDAVVCSLTLHHVAGADAKERARHGLEGPGKAEVLRRVAAALRPDGVFLLNEADIHCDIEIPPGEVLAERLMDSYIRRCAGSVLTDIEARGDADEDLRARWASLVRHWCLGQIAYADVPLADRDVYELDVARWVALLERCGLEVAEHAFTDEWRLFHRYVCRAGRGS